MNVISKALTIPLHLPAKDNIPAEGITILAGDIGGTKTHLALFRATADDVQHLHDQKFRSPAYAGLHEIITEFLQVKPGLVPDRICLGVAGPVLNGVVELTNLNWTLSAKDLQSKTGVKDIRLINDLEATAYGLAALKPDDFLTLHEGSQPARGNIAILAPGTGLGEAGLYWNGKSYFPFPTEGGHCDFSPRTPFDFELSQYLSEQYGVVSWEKVVAGPGIYDIYRFLRDVKKVAEPQWLTDLWPSETHPSARISNTAAENGAAICVETMQHYVRYLGHEAANLVLKMKATGGLFLGGGIPPKISGLLQRENFYSHYMDSDRMQHLLQTVPVRIIRNEQTGLLGAAWFGAYGQVTL
ncbi:glucokinase [Pseudoflavitalea rhizosphaerae]|uniref:glucokinase n=1 Tax=Pseudoflavitalea rhizosphaerae TaxID=1884793 RepID=UPI0013DFCE5D|nr:glucokinase [Pseudoflavitalea rhizosphaerae]